MKLTELTKKLNPANVLIDEPLSKYTTPKVGGPADIFFTPQSTEELVEGVKLARKFDVPVTMLGWGANVLVGDKGIRGLVVRNKSKNITIEGELVEIDDSQKIDNEKIVARWAMANEEQGSRKLYEFKDLDYDESDAPIVEVRMDSGVDLSFAMSFLISRGITGLQWYAKIPATIGGAIYNNIHGGTHFIDELIKEVRVLDENNEIKVIPKSELKTNYDESRFHHTKEIILDAVFNLRKGDKEKALNAMKEWSRRKAKYQPVVSNGCIFQNISNEDARKLGYPTGSVGYIIEHILKMGDERVGGAKISSKHHNFIENVGGASAADYRTLIEKIQQRALSELNLDLKLEIFYLGEF